MNLNFIPDALLLWGVVAFALASWVENVHYVSRPGTWVYRKGLVVRRIKIPVLDRKHWSEILEEGESMDGILDEEKAEVYFRRPKFEFSIFQMGYNPFVGQIKLSKPDILIVRFPPMTIMAVVMLLLLKYQETYAWSGIRGPDPSGLLILAIAIVIYACGFYWFFSNNAVAVIESKIRRITK